MNHSPAIVKTTSTSAKRKKTTITTSANTQWHDPFIEELHETRRKLLAKAGNNMHQLIQNARQTAALQGFVVGTATKK
jgi:hypothetical protein